MWNYRVVKVKHKNGEYHEIRETYYDENGKPNAFAESQAVSAEDYDELAETFNMMENAFVKPVILYDEVTGEISEEEEL